MRRVVVWVHNKNLKETAVNNRGKNVRRKNPRRRAPKNYPKKKSKPTTRSAKRRVSRRVKAAAPRRIRKPQRRKGYATRIRIRDSKRFGRAITVKRRETRIKSKEKIKLRNLTGEQRSRLVRLAQSIALQMYRRDFASFDNLFFLRIRYTYKVQGKRKTGYFSISTAVVESEENLLDLVEISIDQFLTQQRSYIGRGFSNISFDGIVLTTYDAHVESESVKKKKPRRKK